MATSQSKSLSTSTPEYLAFQECYETLIATVKLQPNIFCDSLFAKRFIPETVRDYTRNDTNPNYKKAERLIDSVIDQIKHEPAVFSGFIEVLESFSLDKLVVQLQQCCSHYKTDQECAKSPSGIVQDSSFFNRESFNVGQECEVKCTDSKQHLPVEESEGTEGVCSGEVFVCPYCGECTMEQFFSEGCLKQSTVSSSEQNTVVFPYLNTSGMAEADRIDLECRLKSEMKELNFKFAKLTSHVIRLLRNNITSIEEIKIFLLSLESFTDDGVVKLFDEEDAQEINASKNLTEIFIVVRKYISFINYHILEYIVDEHGIAREHMNEYLETFHTFCRRSIFEVPENLFPTLSRNTAKVYAFKCTAGVATLKGVEDNTREIAKIFCLRPAALQLCAIKEGCVELHFLISAAVAEHIFPASPSQLSALSEIGVRVLSCVGVEQTSREETEPQNKESHSVSPDHTHNMNNQVCLSNTLIDACKRGSLSEVSSLIKLGADVDYKNDEGLTALYVASMYGHCDIVKSLLQAGANIAVDRMHQQFFTSYKFEKTALHAACEGGYVAVVKALINAGADLKIKNWRGRTALHVACKNGHVDVAKTLLQAGTDPNIKDDCGETALYVACENDHVDIAEVLLQAGANPYIENNRRNTAYDVAVNHGHFKCAHLLIQHRIQPTKDEDDKITSTATSGQSHLQHSEQFGITSQAAGHGSSGSGVSDTHQRIVQSESDSIPALSGEFEASDELSHYQY